MKNSEGNYLSNHRGKDIENKFLDEEILEELSLEHGILIDELRGFSNQQISDLIDFGDYNFSKNLEMELNPFSKSCRDKVLNPNKSIDSNLL